MIRFTWCRWYRDYLETRQFPSQAGEALIILFKSLVKHYPAEYFSPDFERFERGGVTEERYYWFREGRMGEAAQSVVAEACIGWMRSDRFYKSFCDGAWSDWQVHCYLRQVLSQEIRKASKCQQSSAWWWMHRLMKQTANRFLQVIHPTKMLYTPISWLETESPPEKDSEQIARELDSLPRWHGEVPQKLRSDALWSKIVRPAFECVRCPILHKDLVNHALRVLEISPKHPIALDEDDRPSEDDRHQHRGQSSSLGSVVEIEVTDWIQSLLSQMGIEHLLVIKLHTCDDLTFRETALQMGQLLSRRVPTATAEYRYKQASQLFQRPLAKGGRSIAQGLPTSDIDQEIFCQIICAEVHARLNQVERRHHANPR